MIKEKAKKTVKKKSSVPASAGKQVAHLSLTLYERGMYTNAELNGDNLFRMLSAFLIENPGFVDTVENVMIAHPITMSFMNALKKKK